VTACREKLGRASAVSLMKGKPLCLQTMISGPIFPCGGVHITKRAQRAVVCSMHQLLPVRIPCTVLVRQGQGKHLRLE